jgi:hypothetical protein
MTNAEIKTAVRVPLRFTTTDGQELPIPDYVAVPRARLEKFEQIALAAQELLRAHERAQVNPTTPGKVGVSLDKLRSGLSQLEEVWDFKTA